MSIYKWYQLFNEASSMCERKIPCEQPVTEADVNEV